MCVCVCGARLFLLETIRTHNLLVFYCSSRVRFSVTASRNLRVSNRNSSSLNAYAVLPLAKRPELNVQFLQLLHNTTELL